MRWWMTRFPDWSHDLAAALRDGYADHAFSTECGYGVGLTIFAQSKHAN